MKRIALALGLMFCGCPTPAPVPAPQQDSVWVVMSETVTFEKGDSVLVVIRGDSLIIQEAKE
jgi:hypothetical protein